VANQECVILTNIAMEFPLNALLMPSIAPQVQQILVYLLLVNVVWRNIVMVQVLIARVVNLNNALVESVILVLELAFVQTIEPFTLHANNIVEMVNAIRMALKIVLTAHSIVLDPAGSVETQYVPLLKESHASLVMKIALIEIAISALVPKVAETGSARMVDVSV